MGPREMHEKMVERAGLMSDLLQGRKESFTRADGTKMVVLTRDNFLDLLDAADNDWDLGEDEI